MVLHITRQRLQEIGIEAVNHARASWGRFPRIWSTEWFKNKESEIQLALYALKEYPTARSAHTVLEVQVETLPPVPDQTQRQGPEPTRRF